MNNDLKRFIENNIDDIENENFGTVYEEAYEGLTDEQCKELTKILNNIFDGIDFINAAKYIASEHVELGLEEMVSNGVNLLTLPSFIRLYMNHICGIDYYEFKEHLIDNPPHHPLIKLHVDNDGELYFERIKKI